jgi:hypothetical protein
LLASDAERRRLGDAGRQAFLNEFTLDHLVERISAVANSRNGSKP